MTTIAQRDLRNRSAEILRKAERGARFIVTVDGRPVAEIGPVSRKQWVPRDELARVLRGAAVEPTLARDLAKHAQRVDSRRDPWRRSK
jgi:prevent-host-death family protein